MSALESKRKVKGRHIWNGDFVVQGPKGVAALQLWQLTVTSV